MRLYRWLLRWSAPSLRDEYGAAMEETLARRLADARAAGRWRSAGVWRRELGTSCRLPFQSDGGTGLAPAGSMRAKSREPFGDR